jgi:hypothetical protein
MNALLILDGLRSADVCGDVIGGAGFDLDSVASVHYLRTGPSVSVVSVNLKIA